LQKNWTAYLCRVQSCTKCADIHCIQRPPFVQMIHHLYLNRADRKGGDTGNNKMEQRNQEFDWDIHMWRMYFHSLPSARVISVGPVCDSQNQVDVISLTGMIQKGKARRVDSAHTVCVQEYHVHSNVDGLRVLPGDFLSPCQHHFVYPWSVRWQPIRFERMTIVFITDCVHTPGGWTRVSPRWCELIHPRVALIASTPSHLLRTRCWHHDDHWSKRRVKSRPDNQVRISRLNLCQHEASFLKSHQKVKNDNSSISKRCMSNDRQTRTIDVNFFVHALTSNKFVCLASKQGFSWVRLTLRDFSIRMNLCLAACCSVSRRY